MSPHTLSPAARRELSLVRRACDAGLCCQASLSRHLGVSHTTLCNWLAGRRAAPSGLFFAMLAHLDADGKGQVLGWLAEDMGVGTVVSLSETAALRQLYQAAAAYLSASPSRRAA